MSGINLHNRDYYYRQSKIVGAARPIELGVSVKAAFIPRHELRGAMAE
jgi:hypothetical protein